MPEREEPFDLIIDAGATYRLSIEYEGVDLTGYTAESQFRRFSNSDDTALSLMDTNGRIVFTDRANGMLEIVLSASDTAQLSGQYRYDIDLTAPGGDVVRLFRGKVLVAPEVTR